jgi:membrane protein DedA with SNARE-associated domain
VALLFTSFASFVSRHGLAAVFAGTFLEGEAVLLTAGALAERGVLDPATVWWVASLGAWVGHLTWFSLARLLSSRPTLARALGWAPLAARLERVDWVASNHPDVAIIALQYLYGARIVGAFALGLTHLSWRRFLIVEGLNCMVWAALFTATGYAAGDVANRVFQGWLRWLWIALSVGIVLGLLHQLSRRFENRSDGR